jgi:hypothetical protein
MRANHSNALPRYLIGVDIATRSIAIDGQANKRIKTFAAGGLVTARYQRGKLGSIDVRAFSDRGALWRRIHEVTRANFTTWIVGHNILLTLRELGIAEQLCESKMLLDAPRKKRTDKTDNELDAWVGGLCCIESPPTIIGMRSPITNGRCVAVDLANWFDKPFPQLCQELGYDYVVDPTDACSTFGVGIVCVDRAALVLNIFVRLMEFVKQNNLGMFRYTAAAQAMSAYRHRFMPTAIYCHDNPQVKLLERSGMFGGRTDCWKIGPIADDTYKLDVNALFPSVMATVPVPYILKRYHLTDQWSSELPVISWSRSIANVAVRSGHCVYPVRLKSEVLYPAGCFRTTLCGLELLHAVNAHNIVAIQSWAEYDTAVLFREFVDELWSMRSQYKRDGNHVYATLTKLLMNSLYGKFAQRSSEWIDRYDLIAPDPFVMWPHYDALTNTARYFRSFGWRVQEKVGRQELPSSFVAISAFITAAARMKMNSLREIAGKLNVFYQGIDSLLVNDTGLVNLKNANEVDDATIGKLKLEGASNYGHIYGPNDYQLGDTVVISGRCGNYVTVDDTAYLQHKTEGKAGLFNNGLSPDCVETQEWWQRRKVYAKGTILPSGQVEPLVLADPLADVDVVSSTLSTVN